MGDIAIRLEGLSKRYHIGGHQMAIWRAGGGRPFRVPQHLGTRTLREALTDGFVSAVRWPGKLLSGQTRIAAEPTDTIWALQDVSCEIKRGEVVGIIGANGAGKSTLLKILSRITEPTRGFAEVHGRVGSLLEVGTGFHPELTGVENVFLNGAILGMKRAEIERKFDEIVAFAEVERFLDTPVKHYSSGMYVRLAFAVAAHLEPEILLVDEVLAVGDARFQKKCLNRMQDVGQQGRTVLFVSHNMPAITRLCARAMLLDEGRVVRDGPSHQVVSAYLTSELGTTAVREWLNPGTAPAGEVARLHAVRVRTEDGRITDAVDIRQPVGIEMEYEVLQAGYVMIPNFQFHNGEGVYAFSSHDIDPGWKRRSRPTGRYVSTVWIPGNLLSEGMMFVGVGLETVNPQIYQFYVHDSIAFQVIDTLEGDSARGDYGGRIDGVVRPLLKWSTQYIPSAGEPRVLVDEEAR